MPVTLNVDAPGRLIQVREIAGQTRLNRSEEPVKSLSARLVIRTVGALALGVAVAAAPAYAQHASMGGHTGGTSMGGHTGGGASMGGHAVGAPHAAVGMPHYGGGHV